MHMTEPPPSLADVSDEDFGAFEALIARALAKAPSDRFQTAVEMSAAVDAAVATRRPRSPPPAAPRRPI